MKLSVTAVGLYKFASTENPAGYVTGFIGDTFKEIEDSLFSTVVVTYLPKILENSDLGVNTDNVDVEAMMNKLDAIFEADNDQEIDAAISDLVDELQRQAVSDDGTQIIEDDMKDTVSEYIRKYYDDAAEAVDGDVTLENFICAMVSELLNENTDGQGSAAVALLSSDGNADGGTEGTDKKIYTTYEELLGGIMAESQSGENALNDINEMIGQFTPYLRYAALAMFAFGGIWLILFLFALIHLFLKNKRFTMWYVKLLGFTPCFIFWVLPLVLKSALTSVLDAEAGAIAAGILGAISSMMWISGACYLALWIVSIFWAFPIKRKIRKLRKNG